MIKLTTELQPGDTIFYKRSRVTVEMIGRSTGGVYRIRHTKGSGFFSATARWFVEEPLDDVVKQAEIHACRRASGGSRV